MNTISWRGITATSNGGMPLSPVTISPPTVGMNPAATYWECPVPDPKFQAPVMR